jgi:glycosyltransferase involved in cell wall biosynthesis
MGKPPFALEMKQNSSSERARADSIEGVRAQTRVYLMDLWSFIPYYMARLWGGLREQGIDVTLGSVRYHLQRDYFRAVGVSTDRWLLDFGGMIGNPLLRRLVKSVEYIVNLIVLGLRLFISRPAILHAEYLPFIDHGFPFEIWFMRYAQRLGIKVIYTVHNVTYQDTPERNKPVYGRAYRTADGLICHGEEARGQVARDFGISADKMWVIPHGPLFEEKTHISQEEARKKLGLPQNEALVLCFGVISEYKGIPFLLDGWKRLVESGTKGRLLIAGTGDARLLSSIREKVSEYQLQSTVNLWLEFIPVEQLPFFYQAADILVFPYKAGTTSGALLTGMNYGKAIVATPLPFFKEYLEEGCEALFVEYADVEGLALTLTSLINAPSERERLGRGVAKKSDVFDSWSSIAHSTVNCYQAIMRGAPPTKR